MKKAVIIFIFLGAIVAIVCPGVMGADTITIDKPGTYSVSASIDAGCMPNPTLFTIADGLTARDMNVTTLTAGANCITGAPADTLGFEIEAGSDIFTYSKYRTGPPQFSPRPLSQMVLTPSTYTLYAYGGRGAVVVLEITVVGSTTPGAPVTIPGGSTTTPPGTTPPVTGTPGSTVPGSSKTTPGVPTGPPLTGADGRWNTDWWGVLTITTTGNSVSGNYEESQGRITGTLSADGRTINGRWSEAPTYESPECAGDFVLNISADGRSLTGWWTFGSSVEYKSDITGTRIK